MQASTSQRDAENSGAEELDVETTYALREGVHILPFDSSTRHATHQVIGSGRRIAVNTATAALFEFLRTPRSGANLEEYASERGLARGEHRILYLLGNPPYSHFIENSRSDAEHQDERPTKVPPKHPPMMFLRFQFFPERAVAVVARWFHALFSLTPALAGLVLITLAHAWLFVSGAYSHSYGASLTGNQWIAVWVGVYATLLFHEIGHCAACSRFGSRAGGIGFGIYLLWPVLYADVSDTWRLSRRQRAVVDMAGIYFHLLASSLCLLLAALTHNAAYIVISKSIILSTAVNLNPFLRFDGYWLITDMTGIPNITKAMSQFWLYGLKRVSDVRAKVPLPELLSIPRQLQVLFATYCFASLWFFTHVALRLAFAVPRAAMTVPHRFGELWRVVSLNPITLPALKSTLIFVLFLAGVLQMTLFASRRLMRGYRVMVTAARQIWKHNHAE